MSSCALVVGINEYPAETSLKALEGAVADAADFADWVLDPLGGNVSAEHLFFWTHPAPVAPGVNLANFMLNPTKWPRVGPDFGRAPTASEIVRSVPEIVARIKLAGISRLYVFLAGHGAQKEPTEIYEEDPQNCFISADYFPDLLAQGLVGFDNLRRFLQVAGPSETVMIFDCCRSRTPLKVGRPNAPYNVQPKPPVPPRVGLARASQPGAVAYEIVVGPNGPTRGAFSKLVVGALREHRVKGRLTLRDLEEFVNAGMADLVKPNTQVADFDERPKPPALILVQGPPANSLYPLVVNFTTLPVGTPYEVRDADTNLISVGSVAATPSRFMLAIGSYSIENPAAAPAVRVMAAFNHFGPEDTNVQV